MFSPAVRDTRGEAFHRLPGSNTHTMVRQYRRSSDTKTVPPPPPLPPPPPSPHCYPPIWATVVNCVRCICIWGHAACAGIAQYAYTATPVGCVTYLAHHTLRLVSIEFCVHVPSCTSWANTLHPCVPPPRAPSSTPLPSLPLSTHILDPAISTDAQHRTRRRKTHSRANIRKN